MLCVQSELINLTVCFAEDVNNANEIQYIQNIFNLVGFAYFNRFIIPFTCQ